MYRRVGMVAVAAILLAGCASTAAAERDIEPASATGPVTLQAAGYECGSTWACAEQAAQLAQSQVYHPAQGAVPTLEYTARRGPHQHPGGRVVEQSAAVALTYDRNGVSFTLRGQNDPALDAAATDSSTPITVRGSEGRADVQGQYVTESWVRADGWSWTLVAAAPVEAVTAEADALVTTSAAL